MRIRNLHQRSFNRPSAELVSLLSTLSSADDRLWPTRWPAMRFREGLAPGATGGHGPVRYRVTRVDPDFVSFEFADPRFQGHHRIEVMGSALRHVLEARCSPLNWLLWVVAIRPLHNALLEDCLDRAERALTGGVARPARWSAWVRLLRLVVR